MRKVQMILLAAVLLLLSLTACADTQKTAASGRAQGSGQYGGSRTESERPAGTRGGSAGRAEGAPTRVRDSGAAPADLENNRAGVSGAQKTVTGKVKSIVGNEVVLIVTQAADTAGQRKNRENGDYTAAGSSQPQGDAARSSGPAVQSQAADQANFAQSAAREVTETYLIPVGMAVGNKDFSAIKAGNTLRLYFGTDPNDGSEIITAVELR